MPRMVNGIGTWFCTAHFDAGWGWDDAVECAMFVYMPVWPLRIIHVQITHGGSFTPDNYQAIPLRWSDRLVRRVFLRYWLAGCIGLGVLGALLLVAHSLTPLNVTEKVSREWAVMKPVLLPLTPCLIAGGIIGQLLIRRSARREQNIRLLLGVHNMGTSDPSTWLDDNLNQIMSAKALFGTETYAEAVPQLLLAETWTGAMWAARLASARESGTIGDELTTEVLEHPGTLDALRHYRQGGASWPEAMGAAALEQYQMQRSIVEVPPLFQLPLIEHLMQKKGAEQRDGLVAGVAAVFALAGLGLGGWLGSMVNIQLALLGAVITMIIAAIGGAFLGDAIFSRR